MKLNLRLVNWREVRWQNRAHFFAVSAKTMRVLKVSKETVMRDWRLAKVWLLRELGQEASGEG